MVHFNDGPATILLVEDNEGDALLAKEALKDSKLLNKLYHVKDGVEAMEFLKKEGEYSGVPLPDLILLDLNMPRMDGRAVLEEVRKSPLFDAIPVIILTTSDSEIDILKSYSLKANCYISKPVDFEKFVDVVKNIEHFWFSIVSLPKKNQ